MKCLRGEEGDVAAAGAADSREKEVFIMPGFDGTGPMGAGSMTGGGRGFCNPADAGYGPGTAEVLAMAGVWAGAAVSEEGLARVLVWAVGMEEAFGAGLFTRHGVEDMPRPTGLTP